MCSTSLSLCNPELFAAALQPYIAILTTMLEIVYKWCFRKLPWYMFGVVHVANQSYFAYSSKPGRARKKEGELKVSCSFFSTVRTDKQNFGSSFLSTIAKAILL